MRERYRAWRAAVLLGWAAWGGTATAVAADIRYREPDFNEPLFAVDRWSVPESARRELIGLLLGVAELDDADPVVRAKALSLAFTMQPGDPDVVYANHALRYALGHPRLAPPSMSVSRTELQERLSAWKTTHGGEDRTEDGRGSRFLGDIVGSLGATGSESLQATATAEGMDAWSDALPWLRPGGLRREAVTVTPGNGRELQETEGDFGLSSSRLGGVFLAGSEEGRNESLAGLVDQWRFVEKAMSAMTLEAEAVARSGGGFIQIDQAIPVQLASALREVEKYFALRDQEIPAGKAVRIEFDTGYAAVEGPSAALSCALLVDAMLTGEALDPRVQVVGDLNADGTVQPVEDVDVRIRKAGEEAGAIFLIPKQNRQQAADALLTQGSAPLLRTQVLSVQSFSEARSWSRAERDAPLEENLREFRAIQEALDRPGAEVYLSNGQIQNRLKAIVTRTPNHLSARLLLLKGMDRHPKTLSLGESLEELLHAAVFLDGAKSPRYEHLREAMRTLLGNRERLHRRTRDWLNALRDYERMQRGSGSNAETLEARRRVDLEFQKLMNDPQARELLMRSR